MKMAQVVKNLKKFKPKKIILFGSWAWGKPKADSDVDLFIIKETKKSPYKRIPEARKHLRRINLPFDILVFTSKEVEDRLKVKDFFISEIVNKGKVLYEAKR